MLIQVRLGKCLRYPVGLSPQLAGRHTSCCSSCGLRNVHANVHGPTEHIEVHYDENLMDGSNCSVEACGTAVHFIPSACSSRTWQQLGNDGDLLHTLPCCLDRHLNLPKTKKRDPENGLANSMEV
mmetsp:Transcript_135471/g.235005  ORF Transcript_135471/g.235005 Transcript_135471/m.235005 type:complete len:125 (+) Transcript_135471:1713-2087(+)